jgi:hypothetical protein
VGRERGGSKERRRGFGKGHVVDKREVAVSAHEGPGEEEGSSSVWGKMVAAAWYEGRT